jgi:hypothetical protein
MAVTAQSIEDGVPTTTREGFMQELLHNVVGVRATFAKFAEVLSGCNMPPTDRRATVSYVTQSMPFEAGHCVTYLEHIQTIQALKDIPDVVRTYGRPDATAAAAFAAMLDRPASATDVDGKLFGTTWAQKAKGTGKPPPQKQHITTTTTTTTTVKKAVPQPKRGPLGRGPTR